MKGYNTATMRPSLPLIKRVAVAAHPQIPEAAEEAGRIATYLDEYGIQVESGSLYSEGLRNQVREGDIDLLLALGGDGTMLRAGHLCGPMGIPILGINMGRFGFLTEIHQREWQEFIPRLMEGDYWLEQRMMLRSELWRDETRLGEWDVLNEVVVTRGSLVRPVHLIASVDGRLLTTYVADAAIASTATGSTAYALAAGGPILPPEMRNILLVAVAPHFTLDRAIVLPEGAMVSIRVRTDHEAVLSVDGQTPVDMADGDRVDSFASDHTVMFVRFQDPGYFYRNLTQYMELNPATENMK